MRFSSVIQLVRAELGLVPRPSISKSGAFPTAEGTALEAKHRAGLLPSMTSTKEEGGRAEDHVECSGRVCCISPCGLGFY